jgi:CRP-like cAMP-binding protein
MSNEAFGLGPPPREGIRDRVLVLRSLADLRGLDDEGLTRLAEHARSRSYRAGETLTSEGDPIQALHVIIDGRVRVARKGEAPRIVAGGEPVELLALLARAPAGLAQAEVDTRALEIPVAAIGVAIDESFSLLRHFLRIMGAAIAKRRSSLPADPGSPPPVDVGVYRDRPRTLVERMLELRASPLGSMNVDALVDLARRSIEHRFPAGHVFWSAGEASAFAIHMKFGRVRCTAPDGRFVDVGSEFTLGVMDLWGGQRRSFSARAETEVIAYRIEFEDFLAILETHTTFAIGMLETFARSLLGG